MSLEGSFRIAIKLLVILVHLVVVKILLVECLDSWLPTMRCWVLELLLTTMRCWVLELLLTTIMCWVLGLLLSIIRCWVLGLLLTAIRSRERGPLDFVLLYVEISSARKHLLPSIIVQNLGDTCHLRSLGLLL